MLVRLIAIYLLLNIGNTEAHLALVLVWLIFSEFANSMTAAQLTALPAGLTAPVCHQTALTNNVGGKDLIVHYDNQHLIPPVHPLCPLKSF